MDIHTIDHLALIENSCDGIILLNTSYSIEYWNNVAKAIFGYTTTQKDNSAFHLFPVSIHDRIGNLFEKVQSGEVIREHEFPAIRRASQDMLYISVSAYPVKVQNTSLPVLIVRDITERILKNKETEAVLNNIDISIVACDQNGIITYFNDSAKETHNLPVKPLPFEDWPAFYDLYHTDGRLMKPGEVPLYRALVDGKVVNRELLIQPRNGPKKYMLCHGQAIYDLADNKLGAVVAMHDITEQKIYRDELFKNKEQYRQLVQNIHEIIFQTDQDGRIIFLNKTWELVTGYLIENTLGNKIEDLGVLTFSESPHPVGIEKILEERTQTGDYFLLKVADGSIRYFKINAHKAGNGSGQSVLGIMTDITEQIERKKEIDEKNKMLTQVINELSTQVLEKEKAEKALEMMNKGLEKRVKARTEELLYSENRYRSLIEATSSLVWSTEWNGIVTTKHKSWEEFTGQSYEEYKDLGWINAVHMDDRETIRKAWEVGVKNREKVETHCRLKRFDGNFRYVEVHAVPILKEDNLVREWIGTCFDIHEQKMLDRQKDEFISIASHELKTPVTSLKAYLQLLIKSFDKYDKETIKDFLLKSLTNVDHLNELISELLDISKIQTNQLDLKIEEVEMDHLVREVVQQIQYISKSHTIEYDGLTGVKVRADKKRMQQALSNLIINAIKYSPGKNSVIVNSSLNDSHIVISITDFGIGIPGSEIKKIFHRFHRVNNRYEAQGLGMGLYITSEIIKLHHGKIWVNSQVNEGTTFSVSLPL